MAFGGLDGGLNGGLYDLDGHHGHVDHDHGGLDLVLNSLDHGLGGQFAQVELV